MTEEKTKEEAKDIEKRCRSCDAHMSYGTYYREQTNKYGECVTVTYTGWYCKYCG